MARLAVGFGSNLGDRRSHLDRGLADLSRHWRPISRSSIYESAPVGPVEQDSFLNAVAVFDTTDPPEDILARVLAAEERSGRVRTVRWGPRTLDLDLLLLEGSVVERSGLVVPHPELTRRRFVVEPLMEAWPEAVLPDGSPVADFLPGVADQEVYRVGPWGIPRWKTLWWSAQRSSAN